MDTISRCLSMLDARVRRSNSAMLASDVRSCQNADYHRLSSSMRLPPEHDEFPRIRKGNKPWYLFAKVFCALGKRNATQETKKRPASRPEATRKKRRPTFIPDPHRRWP